MPKSVNNLTKPEQYVLARKAADALYAGMTPEERQQADVGMRWAESLGHVSSVPPRRGRPSGSKNRKPKTAQDKYYEDPNIGSVPFINPDGLGEVR